MAVQLLLLLCIGVLLRGVESQPDKCPENEDYYDCASSCPLTCENHQDPIFCTKPCAPGCACKSGFVRSPNGKCIVPEDCPIGPCPTNEVSSNCVSPCSDCLQRGKCIIYDCNRGCDCREGTYRNSSGTCVPENQCDSAGCPKNEQYVDCVSSCNDCWNRGECEEQECQSGCDCVTGYFRNGQGQCVVESRCSSSGTGCGANEEYSDCVIPCNDCERRGDCQYKCEHGCDCKKGYHRDSRNVCIPIAQCPHTGEEGISPRNCRNCPKCPSNEKYYICKPTCKTTCDSLKEPEGSCSSDECNSGCACQTGLVRNRYGVCVPTNQCPTRCRENEVFSECGTGCPATCTRKERSCGDECVRGCFCRAGYVRGPDGRCIRKRSCPSICRKNEEYRHCGSSCQATCDSNGREQSDCTSGCVKGCFCKAGFVRGPDGRCIRPQFCPTVCKENEVFEKCGPPCQVSCDTVGQSLDCPMPCVKGCFCKPGFIRSPDGRCIRPSQCPQVCRENEVFKECGSSCRASCKNPDEPTYCQYACQRGCFCKEGFVLGPDGKCIPPLMCPLECGENEVFRECESPCQISCYNMTMSKVCPFRCVKGCFCAPGYVRGPDGKCIRPGSCPIVCNENEMYNTCGTSCPATCDNKNPICIEKCVKGCFCRYGYIRDRDGKCIQQSLCPPECKENENYNRCGKSCPATCIDPFPTCPKGPCVKGCFCQEGHVRGPDGKCILHHLCPPECEANEIFKICGPICQASCKSPNVRCNMAKPVCQKGCFCKEGYVRGPNNKCVEISACPPECDENEVYNSCGPVCQATCKFPDIICNAQKFSCQKGCFCRKGYVRGPSSKCIPVTSCPPMCNENEEFFKCYSPCQRTCKDVGKPPMPCTLPKTDGCFCKPGFIRDPDGRCILPTECPVVCGEYEEFKNCGPSCQEKCKTGRSLQSQQNCPDICVKGCFCKAGYIRGPDGKCILPQTCPIVCGVNEKLLECGTKCPIHCANMTQKEHCDKGCVRGCFCEDGYVRGPDGTCMRKNQCPGVCQVNEMYRECGPSCPTTCDSLGKTITCVHKCVEGCFCKDGYVRNADGQCVAPDRCPVVCPVDEVYKCEPPCEPTCDDVKARDCPEDCIKGCYCRDGFVRGPQGKCIPPAKCPAKCGENEQFAECGCSSTCPTSTNSGKCSGCNKGCICKPGFVKGPTGKCIEQNLCPVVCPANEVSKCEPPCEPTCDNITPKDCPQQCVKGCYCRDGYVRGPDNKCILPGKCPAKCTVNEEFRPCESLCEPTCDDNVARDCSSPCKSGCFCKPGFVRDSNGQCILKSLCPKKCSRNEELKCEPPCEPTCGERVARDCPQPCVEGCYCKAGFVRDSRGSCISPRFCPQDNIQGRNSGEDTSTASSTEEPKKTEPSHPETSEASHMTLNTENPTSTSAAEH